MAPTSTISPPSGRKAQATYRALVENTHAVIAETGGFSGELVAERARLSAATFYAYFPSKDEALAAVLDGVLGDLVDRTIDVFDIERLLEDGLVAVVGRAVAVGFEVFTSSALIFRLALARLPESRTIRHVYRDHQARAVEALERFVRLGRAAGKLSASDEAATTTALLVALQGINNPLLLHRSATDASVAAVEEMIEHLLDPEHVRA